MAIKQKLTLPKSADLLAKIGFDPEQGKIWLDEQRMVLVHASVMGLLRKELVETFGIERTKGFLMRFGYHSGWKDAELAHKLRPDVSTTEAFFAGPQLHAIRGMVRVKPTYLDFDVEKGSFHGEFDWFDSYEADVHLQDFGLSTEPACWTLIGYASGYTTYYIGRPVIFKETQCVASGASHCHIVGKPVVEWEDQAKLEQMLLPDPVADELFSLQSQLKTLRESVSKSSGKDQLFNSIGQSHAFRHVRQLIHKASEASKVTVLLQGETGVGKEVIARDLHRNSDRADKPFVAVNCACIPPDLIEAELFGVEKGAFTGASCSREGRFERASGGTIFLDEVVELSPRAQAALLRVLQEEELERVGDHRTRSVDVRVVAAANEDLETAVKSGKFRADLFFRLNVYPVYIPPLRERTEDIPLLVNHFLEKYHAFYNKKTVGVSDRAMQSIMEYKWPGNVRELENMVERGVILTENNHLIELSSFFPSLKEPSHPLNVIDNHSGQLNGPCEVLSGEGWVDKLLEKEFSLDELEQKILQRAMEKAEGNVARAARMLGITRPQMAYRIKKAALPESNA